MYFECSEYKRILYALLLILALFADYSFVARGCDAV